MDGWLKPVTLPTAEPIALEEAKNHVHQDSTAEDVYIGTLVSAARAEVERITGLALVLQTWDMALDGFPVGGRDIVLKKGPLISVSSITYYDDDLSTSTVFSSSSYQADTIKLPPRIALKYGETWPTDLLRQSSGVVIRFKAGYEVPFTADASADTLTAVGHWFADGDVVRVRVSGGETAALPDGLSAGTNYYVVNSSGDTLQVATSAGGSAIGLADTGTGTLFVGNQPTPEPLRQYMLALIGTMYAHRESEITGTVRAGLRFVDNLLSPYRLWAR